MTYSLISADSHVLEPPDLWTAWLESKYHDVAPKIAPDELGGDAWLQPGSTRPDPVGLVACVGTTPDELKWPGWRYGQEIHPACHEGKARLQVLDADGIDAEIEYPTIALRFVARAAGSIDPQAISACLDAYNRWLIEEFCAADPTRLIGLSVIPPQIGVEASIAELTRAKERGYRGAVLTSWPSGNETHGQADYPFWAAAEEMALPISIHVNLGAGRPRPPAAPEVQWAVGADTFSSMPQILTEMIFIGLFDRFPGLKVLAVETGAGWIPFFLEMMDDRYWRNRVWGKSTLKKVPSQYFHDNWLATFIIDRIGVKIRHAVGLENLAWSTDFPHHGNDWPYSRKVIDEHFANVPLDERAMITCTNAGKLYGLMD